MNNGDQTVPYKRKKLDAENEAVHDEERKSECVRSQNGKSGMVAQQCDNNDPHYVDDKEPNYNVVSQLG